VIADANEHDAPIVRMSYPLDEAALFHAVDETGRVRIRDVEELRDPAHRQIAVALEHRHHVEMAHRHPVPDEALTGDAAQFAQ
jgi:hypothetical protein